MVGLDPDGVESPLEEVPNEVVPAVEGLRVDPVQPLEPTRECRHTELDHQVVVVRHKAVRVRSPLCLLADAIEEGKEAHMVGVGDEDLLPAVSARGYVVDASRDLLSWRSRHFDEPKPRGHGATPAVTVS